MLARSRRLSPVVRVIRSNDWTVDHPDVYGFRRLDIGNLRIPPSPLPLYQLSLQRQFEGLFKKVDRIKRHERPTLSNWSPSHGNDSLGYYVWTPTEKNGKRIATEFKILRGYPEGSGNIRLYKINPKSEPRQAPKPHEPRQTRALVYQRPMTHGCFAVAKPLGISSAQVIRDLKQYFASSKRFPSSKPSNSKRWRKPDYKIGHGGTLDPEASGVLVVGVGREGTQHLASFLDCTKSYDCVVLFGAATDSYDAVGETVAFGPHEHVSEELVREALGSFRGTIEQQPPIYSAIKIQGKPLYQYAREGKEIPAEVKHRSAIVHSLEMLEWLAPGTHEYTAPAAKADGPDKDVVVKMIRDTRVTRVGRAPDEDAAAKAAAEPIAVPSEDAGAQPGAAPTLPAARLRMTVSSGFYVRSLCHDLGIAVGSLGLMSALVRTRQGDFALSDDIMTYQDLDKGEGVWGPKLEAMLLDWEKNKLPIMAAAKAAKQDAKPV